MLLLLASVVASPPQVTVRASATVRIERPQNVSREAWDRLPCGSSREVIVRDEQGRPLLLRLIEMQ
jgi:hypothetical protein